LLTNISIIVFIQIVPGRTQTYSCRITAVCEGHDLQK